jgi:hypothetical protein
MQRSCPAVRLRAHELTWFSQADMRIAADGLSW